MIKKKSIRKLSNFNFQSTKTLYQNNFNLAHCILFHAFQGLFLLEPKKKNFKSLKFHKNMKSYA